MLPTDEYIRLSSVPATPIVLTSCSLPNEQAESMGHHEFTNTEEYERRSGIIDLPLPTPHCQTFPWTFAIRPQF